MEQKLGKYFANESSESECQEILEWRSASEDNASTFLRYKALWAESGQRITPSVDAQELISRSSIHIPIHRSSWFRFAASVAVVLCAGLVFYLSNSGKTTGLTSMVKLDDGSKVTLYKDAALNQLEISEESIVVRLSGKAYFDIVPNVSRSFIIFTNEARIEVLGTSFIVDSEVANTTEVIVETGVVSFSYNPDNYKGKLMSISLKAGEKGLITPNARGLIKQNNRNENYLAWANQELIFRSHTLEDVASLITEVYGYQVEFENPVVKNCLLTATYKQKSPKDIARFIAKTFGFEYTITEGKIVFSGSGC